MAVNIPKPRGNDTKGGSSWTGRAGVVKYDCLMEAGSKGHVMKGKGPLTTTHNNKDVECQDSLTHSLAC